VSICVFGLVEGISRPVSCPAPSTVPLCSLCSLRYVNIIRTDQQVMCSVQYQLCLMFLTFLLAYSKAKLKSNGDKTSFYSDPSE
jgi:hypothetical protein